MDPPLEMPRKWKYWIPLVGVFYALKSCNEARANFRACRRGDPFYVVAGLRYLRAQQQLTISFLISVLALLLAAIAGGLLSLLRLFPGIFPG